MTKYEEIEAVKSTIHSIAGIEFVDGEITHVFDRNGQTEHRPAVGFRATGFTKKDRKAAMDAAIIKLHQAHSFINITVDYPEFKKGLVYLGWY